VAVTLALLPSDVDVVVVIIDVVGEKSSQKLLSSSSSLWAAKKNDNDNDNDNDDVSASSSYFCACFFFFFRPYSCADAVSLRDCGVVARSDKLTGSGTSRCLSSVDACMTGVYT